MSERDALIERVKRQAKLPYNRLCSEVRFIGGPIMETGCGPYHMEKGLCKDSLLRRRDCHPTRSPPRTDLIFYLILQTSTLSFMMHFSFIDYGS